MYGCVKCVFSNDCYLGDHTIYFMAIIDMLTLWSAKKKAAHAAKTVKHGVSHCFFVACMDTPILYTRHAHSVY